MKWKETMIRHSPAGSLRILLAKNCILIMPCCFDALSARLIERSGFPLTFMSGFAVSACRIGAPDTGLLSYGEMLDQGRNICSAVAIPVIGDGDTGYGNAINVKRTVQGYSAAGFAGIMIEDQVWPKRCGHTKGKQVVSWKEAIVRMRAAVDAREEGADILIIARTDARATHGLAEAIDRMRAFSDIGADVTFLEAPLTRDEMRAYCTAVPGPKMANMLEQGKTPMLSPQELEDIGYTIVAYPVTLMSAAIWAMREALIALKHGQTPSKLLDFIEIQDLAGFTHYYVEEERYKNIEDSSCTP